MQRNRLGAWVAEEELFARYETRVAEFLRFRERFFEQMRASGVKLTQDFSFSDYLQEHSAKNLKELVSIEPFTVAKMWAPIAVASIAAEAAELSLGGAEEEAVFEMSSIVLVYVGSQMVLTTWALGNFFKMRQVKRRCIPALAHPHPHRACTCTYNKKSKS